MVRQVQHLSVEAVGMDRQTLRPVVLQGASVNLGGEDKLHEMEVDALQSNGERESTGGEDEEDEDGEADGEAQYDDKLVEAKDETQRKDQSEEAEGDGLQIESDGDGTNQDDDKGVEHEEVVPAEAQNLPIRYKISNAIMPSRIPRLSNNLGSN